MSDQPYVKFQQVQQLNAQLLTLSREKNWPAFIDTATHYVSRLDEAISQIDVELCHDQKDKIRGIIEDLLVSEAEIKEEMQSRLTSLSNEMKAIKTGKRAANVYTAPFTTPLR